MINRRYGRPSLLSFSIFGGLYVALVVLAVSVPCHAECVGACLGTVREGTYIGGPNDSPPQRIRGSRPTVKAAESGLPLPERLSSLSTLSSTGANSTRAGDSDIPAALNNKHAEKISQLDGGCRPLAARSTETQWDSPEHFFLFLVKVKEGNKIYDPCSAVSHFQTISIKPWIHFLINKANVLTRNGTEAEQEAWLQFAGNISESIGKSRGRGIRAEDEESIAAFDTELKKHFSMLSLDFKCDSLSTVLTPCNFFQLGAVSGNLSAFEKTKALLVEAIPRANDIAKYPATFFLALHQLARFPDNLNPRLAHEKLLLEATLRSNPILRELMIDHDRLHAIDERRTSLKAKLGSAILEQSTAKQNLQGAYKKLLLLADQKEKLGKDSIHSARNLLRLVAQDRAYLARVRSNPGYPESVGDPPLSSADINRKENELDEMQKKLANQILEGERLMVEASQMRLRADRESASIETADAQK